MVTKEAEITLARQEVEEVLKTPESASFLLQKFQQFHQLEEEYKLLTDGKEKINLPGEQKRVYQDRIRDLGSEMLGLQKVAKVIRHGYEPYVIPENYYVAEFDREGQMSFLQRQRRKIYPLIWTAPAIMGGILGTLTDGYIGPATFGYAFAWECIGLIPTAAVQRFLLEPIDRGSLNLEFRAPIPPEVLTKYQEAKDKKLFETYLVASPDFELFRETRSIFAEPVLVGYVPERADRLVRYEAKTNPKLGRFDMQQRDFPGTNVLNGVGFLIAKWDLTKDRQAAGLNF